MAFVFATHGLHALLSLAISGSTDIRAGVLTNAGTLSSADVRNSNFVSELLALSGIVEAAASGYSRQDLASVTLTEVDASDNVTLTAAAPTISSVAGGETWRNVFYFIEVGTDSQDILIGVDTPSSTIATNGGNITLPALSVTVSDTSA